MRQDGTYDGSPTLLKAQPTTPPPHPPPIAFVTIRSVDPLSTLEVAT
jgi:hypothetical protein